jgi:hypothetical protein
MLELVLALRHGFHRASSTFSGVNLGFEIWLFLDEIDQAAAQQTLHHQADRAIWGAEHAVDHGDRADGEKLLRRGRFDFWITRSNQRDQALITRHDIVHQADRARLSDGQRHGGQGENHQTAQR